MVLVGTSQIAASHAAALSLAALNADGFASHPSFIARCAIGFVSAACTASFFARFHQRKLHFSKPLDRPLRVLFIHRDLPFHGGVPRCLLYLAAATDPARIKLYIGSLHEASPQMKAAFGALNISTVTLGDGSYLGPAFKLRKLLAHEQIDIVVGTSFKAYIVSKIASIRLYAVPIFWIHAIHGSVEGRFRKMIFRRVSRHDPLLFVSEAVRQAHQPAGHDAPRAVVHNGVEDLMKDPAYVPYDRGHRGEFGISDDAIVIGATGEFTFHKDHPTLIEAMEVLHNRGLQNVHLILIGTGSSQSQVEDLAAKTPAADRIHFLGARTDARKMLGLIDIFAHPALGEGLGLAVVEAMLAARPVVVARTGAVIEYVQDGISGLFFDPRNAVDMANKLELVIRDPQLRLRIGEGARQRALEMFDIDRFAKRISEFVEQTSGLIFGDLSPSAARSRSVASAPVVSH